MKTSDILGLGIGIATGSAIADAMDADGIEGIAVSFVSGGVSAKVASNLLKEIGVDDVVDSIFGDLF